MSSILARTLALLARTRPFDELPESDREALLPDLSIEYFAEGEIVHAQGSTQLRGVYIVESGLVRLLDTHNRRLIRKCGEGDLFGAEALVRTRMTLYEAKAAAPTVCVMIDGRRFKQLHDAHVPVAEFVEELFRHTIRLANQPQDVAAAQLLVGRRMDQFTHLRPLSLDKNTPIRRAAELMQDRHRSVAVIEHQPPGKIVDLPTLQQAISREDRTTVNAHQQQVPTAPARDVSVFDVLRLLTTSEKPAVLLTESDGDTEEQVLAVVTPRDVAHLRCVDPTATLSYIQAAATADELSDLRTAIGLLSVHLYRQSVSAIDIVDLLSTLFDKLVIRAIELSISELASNGEKAPDGLQWTWVRVGDGARREMLFTTPQQNLVLYEVSDNQEEVAAAWLKEMAERTVAILSSFGFAIGEVSASQPAWRKSLPALKRDFRTWIFESDPETLRTNPHLFDLRSVYGESSLLQRLVEDIEDALNVQALDEQRSFLKIMATNGLRHPAPLSLFRRLKVDHTDEGVRYNVRERAILPIVDLTRTLALEHRLLDGSSTKDRLRQLADANALDRNMLSAILEAYHQMLDYQLAHQLQLAEAGEKPTDALDLTSLSPMQRRRLKDAAAALDALQTAVRKRYQL